MNHLTFSGKIGLISHGRQIALLLSRGEKNRRTIDLCMCMHNDLFIIFNDAVTLT